MNESNRLFYKEMPEYKRVNPFFTRLFAYKDGGFTL